MSDIDLTGAVEAARVARREPAFFSWEIEEQRIKEERAMRAALPHIERQVREQVADEIKTASKTLEYDDDEARVLHIAARIARGEQS